MTFGDFVDAAKSSWSAISNASVLLAVIAGAGINATWKEVPTLAAMVASVARGPLRRADTAGEVLDLRLSKISMS